MVDHHRKVIIWDVDETLCHSYFDIPLPQKLNANDDRFYEFKLYDGNEPSRWQNVWGTTRRYAKDVIRELDARGFIQIVWSAGEYEYVHNMVKVLFYSIGVRPLTVLTRDDCDRTPGPNSHTVKDLRKLWNKYPHLMNHRNTIIIDNRQDVCLYNLNSHILVPDYEPPASSPFVDDECLKKIFMHVIDYMFVDDIRKITSVKITS